MSYNHLKVFSKHPQVITIKAIPKSSQNIPKTSQSHSKFFSKHPSLPQIIPKSFPSHSQIIPKSSPSHPKSIPKSFQHFPKSSPQGPQNFFKGLVISFPEVALANKTKMVFLVNRVFGQMFTRNAILFFLPIAIFAIFFTQPLIQN